MDHGPLGTLGAARATCDVSAACGEVKNGGVPAAGFVGKRHAGAGVSLRHHVFFMFVMFCFVLFYFPDLPFVYLHLHARISFSVRGIMTYRSDCVTHVFTVTFTFKKIFVLYYQKCHIKCVFSVLCNVPKGQGL